MSGQNPGQQGGGDVLICPHYGTEYARRNICGLCRLSAAQGAGGPRPAIYMTGGPSGAGKDTLLLGAREALTTKPGGAAVEFLKREITRDPSKTTDLEIPVSVAEFEAHAAAGQYALDWAAHSTQYAIPEHELECALADGKRCVLNVSRTVVKQVLDTYSARADVYFLNITASAAVLQSRLEARGRESKKEIAKRVARAKQDEPVGEHVIQILNERTVPEGIDAVIAALLEPEQRLA